MKRITRICGIASVAILAWLAFTVEPANGYQYYGYPIVYPPRYAPYLPAYSYYPPRPYAGYYGVPYTGYPLGYPAYYTGYYRYPSYYRYWVTPWGGYYYYVPGPGIYFYYRY